MKKTTLTETHLEKLGFSCIENKSFINGRQWLLQVTDDYLEGEIINRDGTWFEAIGTYKFKETGEMAVNTLCRGNYVCNIVRTLEDLILLNSALSGVHMVVNPVTQPTKPNLEKFIINRKELTEAKRLTVFSGVRYFDLLKRSKKIDVYFHLDLFSKDNLDWECEVKPYNYPKIRINKKIGVLINATDEEILNIKKEIIKESEISDYDLLTNIEEECLTDELILRKNKLLEEKRVQNIKDLKTQIKLAEKRIKELEG